MVAAGVARGGSGRSLSVGVHHLPDECSPTSYFARPTSLFVGEEAGPLVQSNGTRRLSSPAVFTHITEGSVCPCLRYRGKQQSAA